MTIERLPHGYRITDTDAAQTRRWRPDPGGFTDRDLAWFRRPLASADRRVRARV